MESMKSAIEGHGAETSALANADQDAIMKESPETSATEDHRSRQQSTYLSSTVTGPAIHIPPTRTVGKLKCNAIERAAAHHEEKRTTESLVYQPLDRLKNEIRLLRILPSTQDPSKRLIHEAASDIIVCELEHECLHEIEEDKRRRDADESLKSHMDKIMMHTLGIDTSQNVYRDPVEAKAHVAQRQACKMFTDEEKLKKGSKDDYHINTPHLRMLGKEYLNSIKTMATWLPDNYRNLIQYSQTFEQWLQNLLWSPLSQHPSYAEDIGRGYYALSYVWADPPFPLHDTELRMVLKLAEVGGLGMKDLLRDANSPKQKEIVLNDRMVSVGENLYEALRALREIPEIRNGTRIWVDSLCIDQSNMTERSEEVKRMDQIYSTADRVISHLGRPEGHADEVLQIMEMFGFGVCDEAGANELKNWFHKETNSPFFHYFSVLMSRSYWSRIWIMQEIALASQSSILICGMKRYPLLDLLLFGKSYARSTTRCTIPHRASPIGRAIHSSPSESTQPIMTLGALMDGTAKLKNIYEMRELLQVNKARLECFNTLWFRMAAENRASDPRDLIYGMLALLPSKLVENIQVNYAPSYTYQQLMIDFAINHIQTYNTLHWILFRPWFGFPKCQEWPSWVPNLGLPFNSSRFWWTMGDWRAHWGIDDTNDWVRNEYCLLHCRGFKCDIVQQVTSPVAEELLPDEDVWTKLPDMLEVLAKDPSTVDKTLIEKTLPCIYNFTPSLFYEETRNTTTTSIYSGMETNSQEHRYNDWEGLQAAVAACLKQLCLSTPMQEDALFSIPINVIHSALLYQALRSENPLGSPFVGDEDVAIQYLSNFLRHNEKFSFWGAKLADFFPGPCDDEMMHFISDKLPRFTGPGKTTSVLDRTSQLARMFTTRSGYLGVALGDLQMGDEIYVLNKCRMPVALRPSKSCDGAYELLGGVFVHGIMQGEAVAEHFGNGRLIQDVALC